MMPGSTPIYGFPYPCPGEVVDHSSISGLANAIDAQMQLLNNDLAFAVDRPDVTLRFGGTQTISANTNTVLTLPTSTFTIATAGVWIVRVVVQTNDIPTVTMMWSQVLQNGVGKFGYTQNTEGNSPVPVPPHAAIVAAAGDVITTMFRFDGAGTMAVFANLDAKLLVRIP